MLNNISSILLSILILFNLSIAGEKVFTVTVKRIMGERDSRDEIREITTLEANRQALEQAGTYLETETVMRDYKLAKDIVIALTAGVTSSRVVDEQWTMERGHFVIILTYEISIDLNDVEERIKALRNDRQKLDEQKRLQNENERLLSEMEKMKLQLENASKIQIPELKHKREQLSDELMAIEWFDKGRNANNINAKISFYTAAIELNPNYADAYINRGNAFANQGEYHRSITDYNKALELNPYDSDGYYNRGNSYAFIGDFNRAIADYNRTIKMDPNNTFAYNNRGNSYKELREYNRAIEDYSNAIKIDPNDADAYVNRGSILSFRSDYNRAISDFTKALEIDPFYAKAYFKRGLTYKYKRDKYNAHKDFKRALQLGYKDAQEELDKLK